ncbi:MAG: dihydrodipicolinate synthase family protein [Synergistaceae bacterium]|jgi:4-hydroxy-2-oxoglutarate aldolase|nr:dihydrodipicolinate synthase family protein [Synergistaceae bacterium]
MRKIEGVFAPIATPFKEDETIDFGRYAENLAKFDRTGLAGITVLGSNGEFTMLSHAEKLDLVAATRKGLSPNKVVIAGTGCESLRGTIELTKAAADRGADAALVINPCYYKRDLTESVLEKFYVAVADAAPVPVMIYNMPGNSGVNLSSKLVVRLSAHENIVGVKDSGGNIVQISEIIVGVGEDFSVFAGSSSFLFATSVLGGRGGTLAAANVAPDLCSEIYALCRQKEHEKAREIQLDILELNACVTSRYGIGGMKAAMDLAGFFGGIPRLPLLPASSAAVADIRVQLEKLGLLNKYQ